MGYAIKNDNSAWRMVSSNKDISHDEYYSEEYVTADNDLTVEIVEHMRLCAYAHPINGSDRYFSEAVRLKAMGAPSDEVATAIDAGIARALEIAAMYPWPEDVQ